MILNYLLNSMYNLLLSNYVTVSEFLYEFFRISVISGEPVEFPSLYKFINTKCLEVFLIFILQKTTYYNKYHLSHIFENQK
jgi:hypothetical protein